MNIDIVMISKLGNGDGGRETWLRNFLVEILKQQQPITFNFFSLPMAEENLLADLKNKTIFGSHHELTPSWKRLPISLSFIIKMFSFKLFKKKSSDFVIGVGGLEEAIAIMGSYFWPFYRGKKILWLRTIYSKEKGYRLNKITQKILLKIELYVIKNHFDLVIANGEDTALFYRQYGVKCTVIANAADLKIWSAVKKITAPKTRIAFIGRLSDVKGINAFLDSIQELQHRGEVNNIEFHVVGGGPIESRVRELEAKKLLIYHGTLPHSSIPEFLTRIDCCVALTYLKDFMGGGGVSNALIEQMAAQQIIVAWNNGIFNKVLNSQTAYLVEQDNIHRLADAFQFISNNRHEADLIASSAFIESQHYSIVRHVEIFLKTIQFTGQKK